VPQPADDLDAVRSIVSTLEDFEADDRERILRWAREKLGLSTPGISEQSEDRPPALKEVQAPAGTDIKSFVAAKKPGTDQDFAATVAYFWKFEAPAANRKDIISADDLQEACRLVNRDRLQQPSKTLLNAHAAGLLDKGSERGTYEISTVGENMVAMTLGTEEAGSRRAPQRRSRSKAKSSRRKKKPSRPVRRAKKSAR
jgi:hypothetical protein